jgi:hypothetical protein
MSAAYSDTFSLKELIKVLYVRARARARFRHAELLSVQIDDTHSYR